MRNEVFSKVIHFWHKIKREKWLEHLREMNENHAFSLITNDCIGGVIYHDLGEQFRSPTVNLWIPNNCYLEFVQNLEYYLSCEIKESSDDSKNYPVGTIIPKDDKHIPIELNFMHYSSFEEACMKWKERSKRVDFDRLYFIWHFYDETDTARIKIFDRWSVKKLAILHEPINGVHSAVITDCYNKDPYNGKILQVIEKTGKRYLDDIDYISFLSD